MTTITASVASILGLPAGSSSFTIPTTPATSTATKVPLYPNFTAGPTGKDAYRPWCRPAVLEGLAYYANGWDAPWSWSPLQAASFYGLGAAKPTTFAVADSGGGTAHTSGVTLRYKLVFGNSTTGKKTAPQTSTVGGDVVTWVEHTMTGTKDAYITWTDPGGEFDKAYIYRALQASDTFHYVATVAAATAAYTDASSDATIRVNDVIVERYRETVPPTFVGIVAHLNALWGWTKNSSILYFSQTARVDGERVQEDFPDDNFVQVSPEDGLGGITAVVPFYDSLFVFKERGCYEVTGSSATTFVVRRMFSQRGALNARSAVAKDGVIFVLDSLGLYYWTPGGEPVVAGGRRGAMESPLRPLWDRMHLAASSVAELAISPSQRLVLAYIPVDFEPVANKRVAYDYATDQFVSVDDMVWGGATGILEDAGGVQHECRSDDFGWLWEDDYAESEGVFAGDNVGTVTSGSSLIIQCSGASFNTTAGTSANGCPLERYSAAGAVLDQNRVYTVQSGQRVDPYYYSSAAVSAGDTIALGVIPAVIESGKLTAQVPQSKHIQKVIIAHDNGVSGSISFATATDEGAFTAKTPEPSLSTAVQSHVPCWDGGWTWAWQISQRYANLGFSVRGVYVYMSLGLERGL